MSEANGKSKSPNRLTDKQVVELCDFCRAHRDLITQWDGSEIGLARHIGEQLGMPWLSPTQLKQRAEDIVGLKIGSEVFKAGDELRTLRAGIRRNETEIAGLREAVANLIAINGCRALPAVLRSPLDPPGTLPFDDAVVTPTARALSDARARGMTPEAGAEK